MNNKNIDVRLMKIKDILRPETKMRSDVESDQIKELARSIKKHGMINPITVTPEGSLYRIIAGERRFLASLMNKRTEVEAYVMISDDAQTFMRRYEENMSRKDVNIVEEAQFLQDIMDKMQINQAALAKKMGKSPQYISDRIQIISYDDDLLAALRTGGVPFSVARQLRKVDDDDIRREWLKIAINSGITPLLAPLYSL